MKSEVIPKLFTFKFSLAGTVSLTHDLAHALFTQPSPHIFLHFCIMRNAHNTSNRIVYGTPLLTYILLVLVSGAYRHVHRRCHHHRCCPVLRPRRPHFASTYREPLQLSISPELLSDSMLIHGRTQLLSCLVDWHRAYHIMGLPKIVIIAGGSHKI